MLVLVIIVITVLQHSSSVRNYTGEGTGICDPLKDSGGLFREGASNYVSSCGIDRWEINSRVTRPNQYRSTRNSQFP